MSNNPLSSDTIEPTGIVPVLDVVVSKMDLGVLVTNAKDVLAAMKSLVPKYKAENYSEDNIGEAKGDRAKFNKLAEGATETRTAKRKEFLKPFDDYSDTVDEIVALAKSTSGVIDVVIKDVEKREKDEKGNRISEWFDSLKISTFTLQQIWNPAWLNKGYKEKDIHNEIIVRNVQVEADLKELDGLNEPDAKASYLASLDIVAARNEAKRLKENRDRLARLEADRKAEQDRVEAKKIEDARLEKERLDKIEADRKAKADASVNDAGTVFSGSRYAVASVKQEPVNIEPMHTDVAEIEAQAVPESTAAIVPVVVESDPVVETATIAVVPEKLNRSMSVTVTAYQAIDLLEHMIAHNLHPSVIRLEIGTCGTLEQIIALSEFMNTSGIEFQKI